MKLLHFLTLITLLTTLLSAKTHEGSFKFMDFQQSKNSFNTTIKVKYSIDTLMGEPLVKAEAKYEIMGLVNIEGKDYDFPQTSTVTNTLNSSQNLYQAYMDLGFYLSGYLADEKDFIKIMENKK